MIGCSFGNAILLDIVENMFCRAARSQNKGYSIDLRGSYNILFIRWYLGRAEKRVESSLPQRQDKPNSLKKN
jgi:hypothetical protein